MFLFVDLRDAPMLPAAVFLCVLVCVRSHLRELFSTSFTLRIASICTRRDFSAEQQMSLCAVDRSIEKISEHKNPCLFLRVRTGFYLFIFYWLLLRTHAPHHILLLHIGSDRFVCAALQMIFQLGDCSNCKQKTLRGRTICEMASEKREKNKPLKTTTTTTEHKIIGMMI